MNPNLSDKKLVDNLIKNRLDYYQLASRPMTIQRFEIIGFFAWKFLHSPLIALPLDSGSDGIWLEKKVVQRSYRQQSLDMLKPGAWEAQKKHYVSACKQLEISSGAVAACKPNKKSLSSFFENWQEALNDFSYYFIAPFWVEEYLFPRLQQLIQDERILGVISSPNRLFFYQRFQKDLILMGKKINYKYLMTEYAPLTEYSLKEKLLDRKEINRRYQEIKEQNLSEDILKAEQGVRSNHVSFLKIKKILAPDAALLADIVHEYVAIRTERIEFYQQALVRVRYFYKLLARLMAKTYPGFNYLDAVSLTHSEIRDFLQDGSSLSMSNIKARVERRFALFYNDGQGSAHFLYKPQYLKQLSTNFLSVAMPENGIIKGSIVSSGIVRGRVRIIYRPDQFKTFKTGEILVSNYTSPAFMSIIKKAAAIITDEGGITSHAAIVSRELGVPCVTGLKIATKVLYDGDLIEVDADKGIVKILK